ncbi:hypothetical protein [Staphylococcus saccharolyticus]|uniref:hypothetical protein n=1 Tax=Staphylococcus saccharolyticus TaxID=33028 RepID=UPI0032DEF5DC
MRIIVVRFALSRPIIIPATLNITIFTTTLSWMAVSLWHDEADNHSNYDTSATYKWTIGTESLKLV